MTLSERIINALEFALNDIESEELRFELTIEGASYEEDKRTDLDADENPGGIFNQRYLGDMVKLSTVEASTSDEHCRWNEESMTREEIREICKALRLLNPQPKN